MRRLSVTEYLIAENQRQSTVTTYAHIGAAIDALVSLYHSDGLHQFEPTNIVRYVDERTLDAPFDGALYNDSYEIGHYAVIGYVHIWGRNESGATVYRYTIEPNN